MSTASYRKIFGGAGLVLALLLALAGNALAGAGPHAPAPTLALSAVAASVQEVDLSWTVSASVSGIATYVVSRDGQALATLDATTLAYVDSSVQPSTQYRYAVEGLDAAGKAVLPAGNAKAKTPAEPDTPDTLAPSEPEDLAIVSTARGNLLDWQDSTDETNVTAYLISRDGKKLAIVNSATLSYLDASAKTGTTHRYTVEAIDVKGHHSRQASGQGRRQAAMQLPRRLRPTRRSSRATRT